MDFTVDGINWILAIQSLGGWLEMPMRFFTFLGYENFFFIVLPLLYWSVDARLGLRVGLILVSSNFLNSIFKLVFASPRPYWISDRVIPFSSETSFGTPSNHAQNAVALWGIMAYEVRKRWAWIAALALAVLIGFSRLYLGVHFAPDVLIGWLIGGVLLWAFMGFWDPAAAWVSRQAYVRQVALAFVLSLIMIAIGAWQIARLDGYVIPQQWIDNALRAGAAPDPISMDGFLTSAGTFFGLAFGAAWIAQRGGYDASGSLEKRALRYVIGVIGILILWMGLGEVFPRDPDLISYVLRYFRYSLVGGWVMAGAPWLFFRFKLVR
jgi:membrane-associated phospholipid phosphatase